MSTLSPQDDAKRHEEERLDVLYALELLDAGESEDFDKLTRLTAFCFDVPVALIVLLDRDRHHILSRFGFPRAQAPRDQSISAYAMHHKTVMVVEDLCLDPRFCSNDVVTGAPHLRFFAGAPLFAESGHAIGTLCIADAQPRTFSAAQRVQLEGLGDLVMNQIELRRATGRRDAVSGLPNRQQFMVDLQGLPLLHPGQDRLLVVLDVFNVAESHKMAITLGVHPVELIVRQLGQLVKASVGRLAVVYHVGVTRFAFLLADTIQMHHDIFLADLADALSGTVSADGIPIRPSVHMGALPLRLGSEDLEDVLRKAMTALTQSIESNVVPMYYDPATDASVSRAFRLAKDIERALRDNEFYLLFQPRLQLDGDRVVSVEALLRWRHPEFGVVSPVEFIPIIERTAVMQAVTLWVANRAIAQLAEWSATLPELRMSINLSPRDFDNDALVPALAEACALHGVAPHRLEVEVTEGEWIGANPAVVRQLAQMRAVGMDVAIDDFGSGYSNFAYLKDIPANIVKLDQSLITDVRSNARHQIVARAILSLARELDYRTVAEGVEDLDTLALLRTWGCDEAQGFCISRPVEAAAIATMMALAG
jgi:EAL domain-containing protein (putative c-di-GMP-specific phosphodiesterase class I)/GAF domain-containing protein